MARGIADPPRARFAAALCVTLLALTGCGGESGGLGFAPNDEELICDWDPQFLADGGVGKDGIPALTNPLFLPAEPRVDEISYFRPTDRIIAYWSSGEWLVIPLNIMWRHEIVNLPEVAITYCPLTGSAMGFARQSVGGAEFGVSGLVYFSNLVMYDRNNPESLWPQMFSEARCGPRSGQRLDRVPVIEMPWEAWIELHPDSKVLALTPEMFDPAIYFGNPYGYSYADPDNPDYLGFPIVLDDRRPPKELVLGIPDGEGGGVAYPFLAMAEVGDLAVFEFEYNGQAAIVLFDAQRQSAMAYSTTVDGQPATIRVTEGGFVDDVSGTTWAVDGTPVAGPFVGTSRRLRSIAEAYVAYWGAWAAFNPDAELALGG